MGLVAIAGSSLAFCACGGSPTAAPPTTRAQPTTTTTTDDPTSVAVLQAYRASWNAFEHALADANPANPELAATMLDPQLEGVKANLVADQRQGIVDQGTFALHPKITALSATAATVVDCAYSTSVLVYVFGDTPRKQGFYY